MTYRRFRAWLEHGPTLIRFDQGKADLSFLAPEAPPAENPLGLPGFDNLTPPPRTAEKPPATASSQTAPLAFK
jgi:hypothetical protein